MPIPSHTSPQKGSAHRPAADRTLANLIRNDDTGSFDLIWSRPKRRGKAGGRRAKPEAN